MNLTSRLLLLLLSIGQIPNLAAAALTIASAFSVVEYTPELIAIQDFNASATLTNGGVANLASSPNTIDLAANAETQGLRQLASHKNLRLIYVVAEVAYRLVASTKKGAVASLADLKGKRIGTMPGTSAAYFVRRMLDAAGVAEGGYTVVSGAACNAAPCPSGSLPEMLRSGSVDAVGMWEPTVQLAINAVGSGGVVSFRNASIYREIYSLYSTAEKLADVSMRRNIVAFLRALLKANRKFVEEPEGIIPRVAKQVKVDETVLKEAWDVHDWRGGLPVDLVDVLTVEDQWVAKQDGRSALARADIEKFVDRTVLVEAMNSTLI